MSGCSRSVSLLCGSVTIMIRTFFRLQILSPSFGVHLLFEECLCTVGCFRRYICFVCPKLSSAFVSAQYENRFLWLVMLVDCMLLFMVGVDR